MRFTTTNWVGAGVVLGLLLMLGSARSWGAVGAQLDWSETEAILARIADPVFPDQDFLVTDFGSRGDGKTDALPGVRAAIAACVEAGGGRVVVPAGDYFLGGPIHLLSGVNLHVSAGARLLFSTEPKDYEPAVFSRWEGVECFNLSPLIYAHGQRNIAVTGKGIVDGQASTENWWIMKGQERHGWAEGMPDQREARARLFAMGEAGVPVSDRQFGADDYLRPSFIQFVDCENVLIEDIRIRRSPMWQIHPVLSRNVTVRGVEVVSHGPNNDGCNPESSVDVLIENSIFDTGDDCIAIKSGRNNDGRRVARAAENIIIRNCLMRDGHGGVVLGSEISGGVRNVFVENCEMSSPRLDRALRIKTNSVRGGVIENIYFRRVAVGEVRDAIVRVNFFYEERDAGEFTPVVRNVILEDVTSLKSRYALYLLGYDRSPIENFTFRRCFFGGVEQANLLRAVKNLHFEEVQQNSGEPPRIWGTLTPLTRED